MTDAAVVPLTQRLFLAVLNASSDAMAISRVSDEVIVEVNEAACTLLGCTRAELVGRSGPELALWPDPARRARFKTAFHTHGRATEVTQIRTRDGHLRDARIRVELLDVDGERFAVSTVTDLTEQRDMAARMLAIVESIADALVAIDADWLVTFANGEAERLMGRPVADALGVPLADVLPVAAGDDWHEHFCGAIRDREPVQFESDIDGRTHQVRAFPLGGGLSFYVRDVAEAKRAEEGRRASERQFRDVLDNVGLIAVMLDREGRITYVNDFLCRLTGWRAAELVGRNAFGTLIPERRQDVPTMLAHGVRTGDVAGHYRNPIRTRSGAERLIAWSNTIRRAADGTVDGITSIGEDITDRVHAEEELELRARQAEALAELGRRALAGVDFDEFLAQATTLALDGLGADRVVVLERGDAGLVPRAEAGRPAAAADAAPELRAPIGAEPDAWGTLVAVGDASRPWGAAEAHFLDAVAHVVAAAAERLAAEEALRESEERRRRVFAGMLRATEEERAAVAADLHDDTVQVITATLLSLDRVSAAAEAGDRERAAAASRKARDTLAAAVDRTRRLMFELRPPLLEAHGLEPALRDLAEQAAAEAGFELDVRVAVGRYDQPTEALVYRTVQEAVANVRKHAAAGRMTVALEEADGALHGLVADDGRGFDLDRALDRRVMRMHLGLPSMMERVRLAGGTIDIDTAPGRSTAVRFTVPIGA